MRLIVGPERHADPTFTVGADLLVLRSPTAEGPGPQGGRRRLELRFNDIADARAGFTPPDAAIVRQILAFGRDTATLAVFCYAGVSRSTAAAYAVACQATQPGREAELAQALRALSPAATPNPLMVALADAALGRGGRMVAAIAAIGRGTEAFEGPLFEWRPGDDSEVTQREIDRGRRRR
ncbi:hypothetical protein [Phenylobacterium sp.]|uniref:tyrosine phosphatase family protein n=1 Tax=Phenylobacterium sp. TaxID=1871053 RepID=UPI00301D71F3